MSPASSPVHFGSFDLDLQSGELRKNGLKVRLGDQPFQVLAMLLEHPGNVVTRDELRHRLWPADTFVDFERSLNAAVKRLREALCDSADHPRFIETLPRHGYRLIVPVDTTSTAVASVPGQVNRPGTSDKVASLPWWRTRATAGLGIILFLVAAGAGVYSYWKRPVLAGTDEVLLGAFTNYTGDSAFDDTLRQGLAVKISESPFLNVVPDERVKSTLAQMKKPANERLSPEVAREVCERESVKAMISGNISRLGSHYVITLEAEDCRSGKSLARLQEEAESKETIIRTLGQAGSKLRRKLGESLKSIAKYDMPIEEATTDSLEALTYYSLGRNRGRLGDTDGAVSAFRQAVALDPYFAMAWRGLWARLQPFKDDIEKKEALSKAFVLRGRVSERERNLITAAYYSDVTGELEKAEAAYLAHIRLYPRDYIPHVNLGVVYAKLGRPNDSVAQAQEALRIAPDSANAKYDLMQFYGTLNRFDEAAQLAHQFNSPGLEYMFAFLRGDRAAMQQWLQKAEGTPEQLYDLPEEATVYAYWGQLSVSRKVYQHAIEFGRRNGSQTFVDTMFSGLAGTEAEFGNSEAALGLLRAVKGPSVGVALAKARAGDLSGASSMIEEISRRAPLDTLVQRFGKPIVLAAIQLNHHQALDALSNLETAMPYDATQGWGELGDAFPSIYLRGYAHLQAGQPADAALDFKKILANPGYSPSSIYYPLAHLGLARAHAAGNEMDKSRKAYEQFLALWKDADSDVPIYKQAKQEYAKIRQNP